MTSFEEKNLEQNKEFLTEMLAVSNNFAGTPVTKIEKDDGQISILKGFTKEEFDQALGFSQPTAQTAAAATTPGDTSTPTPVPVTPTPDPITIPTPPSPVTPPEPTTIPPMGDISPVPTEPEKPTEPAVAPTTSTQPEASQVTPPATTAPAPPAASTNDPQLASILTDLQNMSGVSGAGQTVPAGQSSTSH